MVIFEDCFYRWCCQRTIECPHIVHLKLFYCSRGSFCKILQYQSLHLVLGNIKRIWNLFTILNNCTSLFLFLDTGTNNLNNLSRKGGSANLLLQTIFPKKLHEIETFLTQMGRASLALPRIHQCLEISLVLHEYLVFFFPATISD